MENLIMKFINVVSSIFMLEKPGFFFSIGCEQRERHHSLGVGLRNNAKRRAPMPRSSVCVLQ
jgi:hypothetical protein